MNLKEKRQILIILPIAILIFLGFIFLNSYYETESENNFFDHKIVGEISQVGNSHSSVFLNLKNDKLDYQFYQQRKSYDKRDFLRFVHIGDSIFKKAFSDTVTIKDQRNDQIYQYLIER